MKTLLALLAGLALVFATAGSCGVDGNIIRVESLPDDTFNVYVKDHVNDKPEDAVRVNLPDRYQPVCQVGDLYPKCKDNFDANH